ncbi:chemotaxis protein MotB [Thermanaeromonas toyohensis ToBE]|uniref:Chemotaxis protein MotB n=1 Tax=Thermanaeromonas toyohensis ToBE TaxID=698762 RepID=A0A1W1VWW3_9FIRM|nr:flagellar motor protein MotB [Thermanaeromonas toyohensis]SMB97869.1 chemotaxis protein MotB [Thermanaeromonas toyohensis ToBE]
MRYKRATEEGHDNKERWLLTYSDLITLLMIFFVVMYAISDTNTKKLAALAHSLTRALIGTQASGIFQGEGASVVPGIPEIGPAQGSTEAAPNEGEKGAASPSLDQVAQDLGKLVSASGLGQQITITQEERGVIVRMAETVLFPKGSAELTPQARELISKVGKMLAPLPNYLRIEGHTDNLPIYNVNFRTNWELAAARALTVLHVLVNESGISPERLSATSYGEFRPLVPNDSEENMARNRRVDIVILKENFNAVEPHQEAKQ